ncbi:hypothetical protein L7F22_028099 [Adiantum nelumboides]|nr:hypothetical protein [Adiantum nelumboides]
MSARLFFRRAGVWVSGQGGRAAVHRSQHCGVLCAPCGSGVFVHQRYPYATRSAAADGYLVEVLKSEIEHELREEANKKGSLKGSAGPFELSDKAGTEEVILRRKFGTEQIAITCLVENQYLDEDEEAEQEGKNEEDQSEEEGENASESKPVEVLHLSVTITKEAPMPALEFECTYVRGADEVDIESISFLNEEPSDNDSEPQLYTGPDVDELDENLQRAFHELLKARGLTPKIATYVLDYLTVKEHREYMRWLHNVETFFSS